MQPQRLCIVLRHKQLRRFSDLVNPVDDARAIEKLMKEKYGFKTEFVENPLYEDIYAKISEYNTRRFNPQDQLFIFFAGHGTFDDNLKEGFIAARNTLLNDKGRTTYIPHSILRQRLDNIQCEHIFLVMDVCFGGTLDPTTCEKSRVQSLRTIERRGTDH
ncbi:MAG: caspase family protein [Bacteroidota bacterium]